MDNLSFFVAFSGPFDRTKVTSSTVSLSVTFGFSYLIGHTVAGMVAARNTENNNYGRKKLRAGMTITAEGRLWLIRDYGDNSD